MTNFSIMTQKGTEYINQVLKTDNKIMADGWYISLGIGDIEPTENTENLINPIFGKNDCSGIVFGQDEYGQYAEIIVPTEILKNYHIKEIGLFNHNDLLISVAKTDINLPEDFNFDVKQRIYIKSIPAYITVEYISKDLYMSNLNEKIGSLNQNKANININNLSETGENKLNTSKMYTTGEVSEDEQGFNQLQQMRHSTFDLSKFTIVGSSTITDDGVASGFSGNYYTTTIKTAQSIDTTNANSMDIEYVFTLTSPLTGSVGQCFLLNYNNSAINGAPHIQAYHNVLQGSMISQTSLEVGCEYKVVYNLASSGTSYGKLYKNGTLITSGSRDDFTDWKQNNPIFLYGYVSGENANKCNIDLKQFNVKVDGVEVFSGNKTGIYTIKPDDYTVVGSPVISEDGVVSGFSGLNYLRTPSISIGSKPWDFKIEFKTTDLTSRLQPLLSYTGVNRIFISTDGQIILYANGDADASSSTAYFTTLLAVGAVSVNINYLLEISYNGTNTYTAKLTNLDNNTFVTGTNTFSYSFPPEALQYSIGSDSSRYVSGSIDLNSFKIYVDGSLVYQPCLKIPYTESKSGSKIVDVAYRNRVIDLYEQQGLAGYYTIDEKNKNLTLPMCDIYGLIESKADKASINGSLSLPSKTIEVQTVGASGSTYIAPANGYYCGKCTEGGAVLENVSNNNFGIHSSKTSFAGGKAFLPCLKNDVISFSYDGTSAELTFYYAEGDTPSESEV